MLEGTWRIVSHLALMLFEVQQTPRSPMGQRRRRKQPKQQWALASVVVWKGLAKSRSGVPTLTPNMDSHFRRKPRSSRSSSPGTGSLETVRDRSGKCRWGSRFQERSLWTFINSVADGHRTDPWYIPVLFWGELEAHDPQGDAYSVHLSSWSSQQASHNISYHSMTLTIWCCSRPALSLLPFLLFLVWLQLAVSKATILPRTGQGTAAWVSGAWLAMVTSGKARWFTHLPLKDVDFPQPTVNPFSLWLNPPIIKTRAHSDLGKFQVGQFDT